MPSDHVRSRLIKGRIGVALTAVGFIAMMISLVMSTALPAGFSLVAVLVFIVGVLTMLTRGGRDVDDDR